MNQRRRFIGTTLALTAAAGAQVAGGAFAQSGRVTKIIVPFAAGGVQDILARSLSNELGTMILVTRPDWANEVPATWAPAAAVRASVVLINLLR